MHVGLCGMAVSQDPAQSIINQSINLVLHAVHADGSYEATVWPAAQSPDLSLRIMHTSHRGSVFYLSNSLAIPLYLSNSFQGAQIIINMKNEESWGGGGNCLCLTALRLPVTQPGRWETAG
jgi:hypothetical protein